MARPVWKGAVSFGLVSVPVQLYAAEGRNDISFHLVDSRNSARVRYERVNEETGEEVPWDKIVKGYEYSDGSYVMLSEEELESASREMTRTIDIEQFIDVADIDVRYFDRPYLVVPGKNGDKGYVLLREALKKTGMAGIATVVIRARQHLAALLVQDEALLLILLRFKQELRDIGDFDIPTADLRKNKVSAKEVDLAAQLVEGMSAKWNPGKYHDEYRDVLMKLIEKKIRSGKTEVIEEPEEEEEQESPKTINFMDILKKSVASASRGAKRRPAKKKSAKKKPAPRKRPTKRKRAS